MDSDEARRKTKNGTVLKPNRFTGIRKSKSAKSIFGRARRSMGSDPVLDRDDEAEVTASARSMPELPSEDSCHPFHEVGARMKAAFGMLRRQKKGIESQRRLSRRRRSSEESAGVTPAQLLALKEQEAQRGADGGRKTMGYMQLRAANFTFTASESSVTADDSLSARLLEITGKDNFCDVEMVGKDNVAVQAPGFLLACHSTVFEKIFYPKGDSKATYSILSPSDPKRIHIKFASRSAIEAAIHFCATLQLPPELESQPDEANVRTISQLHLFARLFKVPSLLSETYRTARRVVNKDPPLACAAFDECNVLSAMAESENNWGLTVGNQKYDDLRAYALEYLRESPMVTIMGPKCGAVFLGTSSVEAIACDQEIDVDEYSMWRILNLWVKLGPGTEDDKIALAKSCATNISLVFISPLQLEHQVKKCGWVDPNSVDEALKEIESMLENESPDDKERVIVEGAGDGRVNGVYVLADDEVGLNSDEVMFLKEGDDDDEFGSGFGLFLWDETWGISSSNEYFNVLYSCKFDVHKGHSRGKPPKWGWKCEGGTEEPPTCTWKAGKEVEELKVAPSLMELKKEKLQTANNRASTRSHCGHALGASLTLSQMMTLPEDEDCADDYRYASGNKDLDAMMHMSVDEGHDDEEAGYNVNYLSATLFSDSSTKFTK